MRPGHSPSQTSSATRSPSGTVEFVGGEPLTLPHFKRISFPFFNRPGLSEREVGLAHEEVATLARDYDIPRPRLTFYDKKAYSYYWLARNEIGLGSLSTPENFRSLLHREMAHLAQGKLMAAAMLAPAEGRRLPGHMYSEFKIHADIMEAASDQNLHRHANPVRFGERLLLSRFVARELDRYVDETLDPSALDAYLSFRDRSLVELGPTIAETSILRDDLAATAAELRGTISTLQASPWKLALKAPIFAGCKITERRLNHRINDLDKKLDGLLDDLSMRFLSGAFDPSLPKFVTAPTINERHRRFTRRTWNQQ